MDKSIFWWFLYTLCDFNKSIWKIVWMERVRVYCVFGGAIWEVGGIRKIEHDVFIVPYKISHTVQVTKNPLFCTLKLPSLWHISYNQFSRLYQFSPWFHRSSTLFYHISTKIQIPLINPYPFNKHKNQFDLDKKLT